MEVVNFQKDSPEQGSLRLVADSKGSKALEVQKQFVNFMFFRVNPDWRKLAADEKRRLKGFRSGVQRIQRRLFALQLFARRV